MSYALPRNEPKGGAGEDGGSVHRDQPGTGSDDVVTVC